MSNDLWYCASHDVWHEGPTGSPDCVRGDADTERECASVCPNITPWGDRTYLPRYQ